MPADSDAVAAVTVVGCEPDAASRDLGHTGADLAALREQSGPELHDFGRECVGEQYQERIVSDRLGLEVIVPSICLPLPMPEVSGTYVV